MNHGWTGPGADDKDWWQHATTCSDCKDPDTTKPFSWSSLGQFTPIDLRVKDGASEEEASCVQEAAVLEIVKRIMSRFHRGEHIQHCKSQYSLWRKAAVFDLFLTSRGNKDKMKADVKALFENLDIDKNGVIDKSELIKGFPQLDDKTADLLMAEVDVDDDGSILFEELWGMIQSIAQATGVTEGAY